MEKKMSKLKKPTVFESLKWKVEGIVFWIGLFFIMYMIISTFHKNWDSIKPYATEINEHVNKFNDHMTVRIKDQIKKIKKVM